MMNVLPQGKRWKRGSNGDTLVNAMREFAWCWSIATKWSNHAMYAGGYFHHRDEEIVDYNNVAIASMIATNGPKRGNGQIDPHACYPIMLWKPSA